MATLTTAQLSAMNFGYLVGTDLMQYASIQLLIAQYEKNNNALVDGCNNAYSEMIGYFATKYNVQAEYNMISGPRQNIVVKITAILAVRDIFSSLTGIGPVTEGNIAWAENIIARTLQGEFQLPLFAANCAVESNAQLVRQNFRTWG